MEQAVAQPTAESLRPKPKRSILVIDDDAAMRSLFEIYLSSYGYGVLLAPDGEEAMRLAAGRTDIGVIMMDVVMPGLSGQPLVDAAKAAVPGVRFLFCSGHPTKILSTYGIDLRAGRFLQKPCRPADLKLQLELLLADD